MSSGITKNFKTIEPLAEWNEDVVLERNRKGKPITNVPRRIIYHSPDGYEWGYGGSGPSDLALNILSLYVGGHKAWQLHQAFKWAFLAKMPIIGGTIKHEAILNWLKTKRTAIQEVA
jgi:hypothetical protein